MPYGTPTDPVAGTVITVAYAIANLLDPIRALRAFTGGADPPGSNYWLRSTSVSAVSWVDRGAEVLAAIGFTPVNKAGDSGIGALSASTLTSTGAVNAASAAISGAATVGTTLTVTGLTTHNDDINMGTGDQINFAQENGVKIRLTADGAYGSEVGTGRHILNTNQHVSLHNAAAGAGDYSFTFDTTNHAHVFQGTLTGPTINGTTDVQKNGTSVLSRSIHTGTQAPSTISPNTPTATPTANAIPIADGTGKLDAWVTSPTGFPTSAVVIWPGSVASIPSGWTRWTAGDGRMLVGDGTTFSVTFTTENNYGSSWSHTHPTPAHAHSGSSLGITGSTGAESADNGLGNNGGVNTPAVGHTHDQGTLDVTGSTATDGGGTSGSTAWQPPVRAVVYIQKS